DQRQVQRAAQSADGTPSRPGESAAQRAPAAAAAHRGTLQVRRPHRRCTGAGAGHRSDTARVTDAGSAGAAAVSTMSTPVTDDASASSAIAATSAAAPTPIAATKNAVAGTTPPAAALPTLTFAFCKRHGVLIQQATPT